MSCRRAEPIHGRVAAAELLPVHQLCEVSFLIIVRPIGWCVSWGSSFSVLNTLGALLWATTLSVAGYRLGRVLELAAIWQGRESII
jgi:hypothetical protein